jgi:hypothetical protein
MKSRVIFTLALGLFGCDIDEDIDSHTEFRSGRYEMTDAATDAVLDVTTEPPPFLVCCARGGCVPMSPNSSCEGEVAYACDDDLTCDTLGCWYECRELIHV